MNDDSGSDLCYVASPMQMLVCGFSEWYMRSSATDRKSYVSVMIELWFDHPENVHIHHVFVDRWQDHSVDAVILWISEKVLLANVDHVAQFVAEFNSLNLHMLTLSISHGWCRRND
jgi:hypothetical protein